MMYREYVLSGAYTEDSPKGDHFVESRFSDVIVRKFLLPDVRSDITDIQSLAADMFNVFMSEVLSHESVVVYVNGPKTMIHALYWAWEAFVEEARYMSDHMFEVGELLLAHWDKVTDNYIVDKAHNFDGGYGNHLENELE